MDSIILPITVNKRCFHSKNKELELPLGLVMRVHSLGPDIQKHVLRGPDIQKHVLRTQGYDLIPPAP